MADLVPLGLPLDQEAPREKEAPTSRPPSLDPLFASIELRVRIEQRIGELEREAASRTGRERQISENLIRELRALLRPPPKP